MVLEEFCIVTGIVIAFWITFGTRYMAGEWSWRLPFLLQMVPSFVLAGGVIALPFSPRWLVSKGRNDDALKTLCRLRRLPPFDKRIQLELMDIEVEVRFHQEMNAEKHPDLQGGGAKNSFFLEIVSWADCFRKSCWRRTHIGIMLMFFQQVSTELPPDSQGDTDSVVRRDQRTHLLLAHAIQDDGFRLRDAAYHVGNPERDTVGRRQHQRVDDGHARQTIPSRGRVQHHDDGACHHSRPRWALWEQLAGAQTGRLGQCSHVTGLHASLRGQLGASAVGHAVW